VSAAAGAFTDVALDWSGSTGAASRRVLVTVLGTVLALFTSTLLFLYLFIRLPKVQTPWREIVKGALLARCCSRCSSGSAPIYIERTTENPLYGAFAVVVGLLVWINLVSRMLLFCAAWTSPGPTTATRAPSGTASPEQARKAGIPASSPTTTRTSRPRCRRTARRRPLLAARAGATPPQDEPSARRAGWSRARRRRRGRVPTTAPRS
jgi:membrane protein